MRFRRRPIPQVAVAPALALALTASAALPVPAVAQSAPTSPAAAETASAAPQATEAPSGWRSLFLDATDGQPDLSNLLLRGGFIPVPVVITEPAVDGGLGLVGYFVKPPPEGAHRPPERSILAGAVTGNGSTGIGALHSGSVFGGDLLYSAAAAHGLAILDLYPGGRDVSLAYDNVITYLGGRAHYRIPDTGFSAGPTVAWRSNDVALDTSGRFPRPDPFLGRTTDLLGLGGALHYDDRDNPLTPKNGLNVIAEALLYDESLASDADFSSLSLVAAGFRTEGAWTYAGIASAGTTFGDAPFFMEPGVTLRGVPFNRYTGDRVISLEGELRRRIAPRWAAVAFAGVGHAHSSGSILSGADSTVVAGGVGVRFEVARKLGLDMGVDLAFGEDGATVYLQFGHAWGPQMD
ncbi:hypothetical protein SAMN05444336_101391 [Albimonas donghaensis]|uniref:Surface antigen n=1 Tax=Albimonas donghaensis TaxID=356660 RepID=A0A1H2RKJ8_9RHOB|nr:hypothetical protein [Albimonas donghaensis]SDW19996.1 hypothetical protein SAMN05444336_101391 [Albimonas donghaensis]